MVDEMAPDPVVPAERLIPVTDTPRRVMDIPASRMFLINKSLATFRQTHPGEETFDASQGDGGASLPGVPAEILDRAQAMQKEHGCAYDMPYGTDAYRRSVVEQYWGLDAASGLGPANVLATVGGRDALVKAYAAMIALGHGREGDFILVSRVPWISYNWGPYGVGANVLRAPGSAEQGWAYTEEGLQASVEFAARDGRKIAGLIVTSPDNPTGNSLSAARQAALGRWALRLGIPFVLFDWMYHYVTDEEPMNLNAFLQEFEPADRARLMFLDGITKSLGASNVRNSHLIAGEEVVRYITARASHAVIPPFYSMAVAMAAYAMGYRQACRSIVEPTNASRRTLAELLPELGFRAILGQGYYAFLDVGPWLRRMALPDSESLGRTLAERHGLAVVPGAFFSPDGGDWIRFSYATPVDKTVGAAHRLAEALNVLAPA
jgi:aspartate aminotransferase